LYSLGYKIDFKNRCVVATGGIYTRTEQAGIEVIIDSDVDNKTNFFSNSVFVQDLLPQVHNVLVKKDGYISYQKDVLVKEKEVTKIENITLFRNDISFNVLASNVDYFLMSPDEKSIFLVRTDPLLQAENKTTKISILGLSDLITKSEVTWPAKNGTIIEAKWSQDLNKILIKTTANNYFVFELGLQAPTITALSFLSLAKDVNFNPQNSNQVYFIKNSGLYNYSIILQNTEIDKQSTLLLKNILAYKFDSNNLIWLGVDGNLNQSDTLGKTTEKLTSTPLSINKSNSYKIFRNNFGMFVLENLPTQAGKNLLLLNNETKTFEQFLGKANDLKNSPNNQNGFYITDNDIWLDHSNYIYKQNQTAQKVLLNKFYEKISDCFWLNNDYIIFRADSKIKISEIDNRGNINIIDLPDKFLTVDGKMASMIDPDIYFNLQDKKLYVLTGGNLITSDKLLP
jgi:hypothetical protein